MDRGGFFIIHLCPVLQVPYLDLIAQWEFLFLPYTWALQDVICLVVVPSIRRSASLHIWSNGQELVLFFYFLFADKQYVSLKSFFFLIPQPMKKRHVSWWFFSLILDKEGLNWRGKLHKSPSSHLLFQIDPSYFHFPANKSNVELLHGLRQRLNLLQPPTPAWTSSASLSSPCVHFRFAFEGDLTVFWLYIDSFDILMNHDSSLLYIDSFNHDSSTFN